MKKLTLVLLATLGCSVPEPEPKGRAWDTKEVVEFDTMVSPEPVVLPEVVEADPNGENYREIWGREHRQRYVNTGNFRSTLIPPGVLYYGGMRLRIIWPQPQEESNYPDWMVPKPDQERWLTIALLSSSDPRPRKFDITWYDGKPPRPFIGPWSADSLLYIDGPYELTLQDRHTASRFPEFIRDISDFDEIYVRLDVPSTGHFFERICRRMDDYTEAAPTTHWVRCQLTADDLSSWD